jgi:hypothetical protein
MTQEADILVAGILPASSSQTTIIYSSMGKVEDRPLPSYSHAPTPQATRGHKRLWAFALLAGMLVFTVNFRGVLKATTWKPCHAGYGNGRLHTKPVSHYTLPSGDKIPSVALGESALDIVIDFHLPIYLRSRCVADR